MRRLLLLFLLLTASPAFACLNYFYSVDREGELHQTDDILDPLDKNFNAQRCEQKLLSIEKKLQQDHSYQLLSDYSVLLMKLGRAKEALAILQQLYWAHPDEFRLASNLGTAYELNGQVDSALKYIRRGMELNPQDHEGSEWVHVKVLEAKLQLAKDPSWLKQHTVLQLTEAQEKDSMVRKQIFIQVRERFPFTPGPDAIMASILEDLGDCFANTASLEYAKVLYSIALNYYVGDKDVLEKKIGDTQALIRKYESVKPVEWEPGREGTWTKLSGMRYQDYLRDNDPDHYAVHWEKINLDVKALLSLANVPYLEPKPIVKTDSVKADTTTVVAQVNEAPPPAEKNSGWLVSILLSAGALSGGIFLFGRYRKRR